MMAILRTLTNCLKTLNLIYNLLESHLSQKEDVPASASIAVPDECNVWDATTYTEDELVTVKEAEAILKVSRWKIEDMCNKGELTIIRKGRSVRLIKAEVDAARVWYSAPKGKV
ncbi:helix-turn-helix domain-containing protein [Sphingobacterium pedocola]|nr:helix-turn-helix domain-containing protein [Sphingobacterium pedocola]